LDFAADGWGDLRASHPLFSSDESRGEQELKAKKLQDGRDEVGVGEGMLLVAIGCGRLPGMLNIAAKHALVVFGTMEGTLLAGLTAPVLSSAASALSVYFYEAG
jgi:hypothetical protein